MAVISDNACSRRQLVEFYLLYVGVSLLSISNQIDVSLQKHSVAFTTLRHSSQNGGSSTRIELYARYIKSISSRMSLGILSYGSRFMSERHKEGKGGGGLSVSQWPHHPRET